MGEIEIYPVGADDSERRLKSIYIQLDYDWPGTASSFGFQACECGETDGTIDCSHRTASDMIQAARLWLDDHEGEEADDPGYFE